MDDAALERIDRRLAVTEEFVRQSAEALPKIAEYIDQGHEYMLQARAASERQERALEDLRISTRQWNLRQEKMMRELLAAAQQTTATAKEMTASLRDLRNEGREEARAQRAALFAILDQLKAGGGPATA